jgi:hypothetical protein
MQLFYTENTIDLYLLVGVFHIIEMPSASANRTGIWI